MTSKFFTTFLAVIAVFAANNLMSLAEDINVDATSISNIETSQQVVNKNLTKKKFSFFKNKKKNIKTIKGDTNSACEIDKPCENDVIESDKTNELDYSDAVEPKKSSFKEKTKTILQEMKIERTKPVEKINVESFLMLNDEQVEAAKANRLDGEEKIRPINEEIKKIQKKIEIIKWKNEDDDARKIQLEPYYNEIKRLNLECDKIRAKNVEDFETILTPEQKLKFEDIKKINIQIP